MNPATPRSQPTLPKQRLGVALLDGIHRPPLRKITRCTPRYFKPVILKRFLVTLHPGCCGTTDLAAHPERREDAVRGERIDGERGVTCSSPSERCVSGGSKNHRSRSADHGKSCLLESGTFQPRHGKSRRRQARSPGIGISDDRSGTGIGEPCHKRLSRGKQRRIPPSFIC